MERLSKITVAMLAVLLLTYAAVATNNMLVIAKKDKGSSGSDKGSGSDSGSSSNNNNNGDKGSSDKPKTDEPKAPDTGNNNPPPDDNKGIGPVTDAPITPANPPSDNNPPPSTPKCDSLECNNPPVTPQLPPPVTSIPDMSCAFHPDAPSCHPDPQGNCPPHFAHNVHGNCFPEGKCPVGSGRHDGDESGTCFPNHGQGNFCLFHKDSSKCITPHHHPPVHTIVKVIHKTKIIHRSALHTIATVFVPGIGLVEPFNCKLNADKGKIGCEFIIVKVIA